MSEEIIIEAGSLTNQYLKDLYRSRRLFFFIAWRDILVRYKQTVLGLSWALVRPFLNTVVFVLIFDRVANLPSEGVPYPLFVLSALLPWQLFSGAIQSASQTILNSKELVTKVYFPRLILPMSSVAVNVIDGLIGYLIFLPWLFLSDKIVLGPVYFAPLYFFELLLLSSALSIWLSSLTIRYRDMVIILPFFIQVGLYLSPIGYASTLFPERYRSIYLLNPLVGIIDGFRWTFFSIKTPDLIEASIISWVMTLLLLVSGYVYFCKTERRFADIL